MSTAWTVVTRKNGRGQFRKTGFEGTWHEASDHGRNLAGEDDTLQVWLVDVGETRVLVSGYGERDRWVTIAPTKAERAAAKAEVARIEATADDMFNSWAHGHLLRLATSLGLAADTPRAASYRLAEAGWTRRMVGNRLS